VVTRVCPARALAFSTYDYTRVGRARDSFRSPLHRLQALPRRAAARLVGLSISAASRFLHVSHKWGGAAKDPSVRRQQERWSLLHRREGTGGLRC